jgi:hypothetical protein
MDPSNWYHCRIMNLSDRSPGNGENLQICAGLGPDTRKETTIPCLIQRGEHIGTVGSSKRIVESPTVEVVTNAEDQVMESREIIEVKGSSYPGTA